MAKFLFEVIGAKIERDGIQSLSEPEKDYFLINQLAFCYNGGFKEYLERSDNNYIHEAVESLRRQKFDWLAEITERVIALFSDSPKLRDEMGRLELLAETEVPELKKKLREYSEFLIECTEVLMERSKELEDKFDSAKRA